MKAVNLIPTEQRRVRSAGGRSGSAYVLIGVLAALVAMLGAYVFTSNNVTERKADAAAAKAEANRLQAVVAQRGAFTNFAQIKDMRLASVSTIAETRFDWERLIRELSRVMPSGGWLQSADASVTGEVAGAETAATNGGVAVAPQPKANLIGCTPKQSDVARLMVRMNQVHRVSDVELNQSSTELGAGGEVSFDSCGSYYQFDVTLSFDATQPKQEAPRGESRVPASLGGGS